MSRNSNNNLKIMFLWAKWDLTLVQSGGKKDRKRAQSLAHKPSKFLAPATSLSGQNLSVPSALND